MKVHYLEIVASDVDAVCATYEAAHGTKFGPSDPLLGGARTARLPDGGSIGVRGPLRETEKPVVRPYWLVDDIESALDAATKQGAFVAHPPLEIPGKGTFAISISREMWITGCGNYDVRPNNGMHPTRNSAALILYGSGGRVMPGVSRYEESTNMGLLTFSINITLDGCVDHQEGIADDETHAFFTRLMDEGGAMLWGRVTYEMMESYWPAVARGEVEAPPAIREWGVKLEAKPKYVVSSTRKDFRWNNTHHISGNLRTEVQKLKDATPAGVLLGSGQLATELDQLNLIDEYIFLVHPRIVGHGPYLFEGGLSMTRRLERLSVTPLRNGAVALHYRRANGENSYKE